ncbi:MAG: hypothetical protein WBM37_00595 [Nitrososphaeraceae archaeon]
MVQTQITRIRNFDGSQTLRKHSDGSTLPYSGPNLTTMLSGVTDPIYVLQRINAKQLSISIHTPSEKSNRVYNCKL